MAEKIILGITQGDSNGIGYEVIIKALSDARIIDMCVPIVYGSSKIFGLYKNQMTDVENISTNIIHTAKDHHSRRINIINCVPDTLLVDPGHPTSDSAKAAIIALERAVGDLKGGFLDAIVTGPFNKRSVNDDSFAFTGHTEYLVNEFKAEDGLMFLCSDKMRVGVATNHLPISKLSGALTIDRLVGKLKLMNESLKKDFNIVRPKIAVLGLNPHCGDNGLLGNEEINVISPAVKKVSEEGILAYGPFSSDGFFANNLQYTYDAVLAMYHDQGLIPFKALSFDTGVNFTAGLSIVRTSPDHGTAYELVGRNVASSLPMLSAIYTAIDVVRNRKNYHQIREDVMTVKMEERGGYRGGSTVV